MCILRMLVSLLFGLKLVASTFAAVPNSTIVGPVEADPPGHPSRNSIYAASAIELSDNGYSRRRVLY